MADFFAVTPSELKFRFEVKKNIPVTLTLQNSSTDRVAFKVKTTSPKKYCVRPSNGFVEANSSREVQVILQAQREAPASLTDVKDKFLVQAVRLSGGLDDQYSVKEVKPELFDVSSGSSISQTKLRVVFVEPPKPPSPVPEGVEEPGSPSSRGTPAGVSSLRQAVLSEPSAEKAEIRRRLAAEPGASVRARRTTTRAPEGYALWHLVLVAIIAFVLGRWLSGEGYEVLGKYIPGLEA